MRFNLNKFLIFIECEKFIETVFYDRRIISQIL